MDVSIRESYERFPRLTSRFWTWLTGKPAQGQSAAWIVTPLAFAAAALCTFAAGIGLSGFALQGDGGWRWVGLVAGWGLTVNGARRMVSTVIHQCIHGRFSDHHWVDNLVADAFALLTLTETPIQYRREHFVLHHRDDVFTTSADPAAAFLRAIGVVPGVTVRRLWQRLLVALVSPRFHLRFLAARLISNLATGSILRRSIFVGSVTALALLAILVPDFGRVLALAYLLPVTILYHDSVLLEFVSEHAWFAPRTLDRPSRHVHATHSWGRFCGRRLPGPELSRGRQMVSWAIWLAEHLFYHLPVRVLVLPGDLPQHDFHHRNPATRAWTQAAYARELEHLRLDPAWPAYQEFWGLHAAINHVFAQLASQPIVGSPEDARQTQESSVAISASKVIKSAKFRVK